MKRWTRTRTLSSHTKWNHIMIGDSIHLQGQPDQWKEEKVGLTATNQPCPQHHVERAIPTKYVCNIKVASSFSLSKLQHHQGHTASQQTWRGILVDPCSLSLFHQWVPPSQTLYSLATWRVEEKVGRVRRKFFREKERESQEYFGWWLRSLLSLVWVYIYVYESLVSSEWWRCLARMSHSSSLSCRVPTQQWVVVHTLCRPHSPPPPPRNPQPSRH